jgi:hypothetical protein
VFASGLHFDLISLYFPEKFGMEEAVSPKELVTFEKFREGLQHLVEECDRITFAGPAVTFVKWCNFQNVL